MMVPEMLTKGFHDGVTSRTQTFEWYSGFRSVQNLVEDYEVQITHCQFRKCRENVLNFTWGQTHMINNVHNILCLLHSTCQHILVENLNMRLISAKFMPCLLNVDQQQNQLSVCKVL
jgi:hypothetical protein